MHSLLRVSTPLVHLFLYRVRMYNPLYKQATVATWLAIIGELATPFNGGLGKG